MLESLSSMGSGSLQHIHPRGCSAGSAAGDAGMSQGTAGTAQRAPAVWQADRLCQIACEPANKSSRGDGVSKQLSSLRCCFYFQHQGSNAETLQRGRGEGCLPLFTLISCRDIRRAFPRTGFFVFCNAKAA